MSATTSTKELWYEMQTASVGRTNGLVRQQHMEAGGFDDAPPCSGTHGTGAWHRRTAADGLHCTLEHIMGCHCQSTTGPRQGDQGWQETTILPPISGTNMVYSKHNRMSNQAVAESFSTCSRTHTPIHI